MESQPYAFNLLNEICTVLYALLSVPWHWNFQRVFISTRRIFLVWKLKKATCSQIDFLSF